MSTKIVALIPDHHLYCEPFCGGASVFFRKTPSMVEVLNDHNAFIVNFYQVLQQPRKAEQLKALLQQTPYARQQLQLAKHRYANPNGCTDVQKARAFRVLCNLSFSGMLTGGYKYSKQSNKNVKAFHRKKEYLNEQLIARLNNVDLECRDAISVIKSRDDTDSFFYVDPPYIGNSKDSVNQGHYEGYTPEMYDVLLDTLSQIKGKFLLSNYPSELLDSYIKRHGRQVVRYTSKITANNAKGTGHRRDKTELLVANYPIMKP